MAIPIEERFEVAVPIAQVWAYFSNPPRVAPCLPGAELLEVVDEKTYKGRVRVQVGPVAAQFLGLLQIESSDAQQHVMILQARGDQQGVAGRAEARIAFSLRALAEASTEVVIVAELAIAGRLAQLGSGLIQTVSRQLFRKFAACVRREMLAANE